VKKIETTPYYLRPPCRKNRYEQIDQFLCAIPKGSSSIRFRAETTKILEDKYTEHIKICTDGSKKDERVGCGLTTTDQKFRKRLKPQNTAYSVEQEAIIKSIYVTQRTGRDHNGLH
jgi:hypothetical protein